MSATAHPDDRLVDYVDDRLDETTAAAIRAHLTTCEACRAVHAEVLMARDAAATLRDHDVEMPADLLAAVSRRLDAEGTRAAAASSTVSAMPSEETRARWAATRRRRWWAAAAVAAALVAYLLSGDRPAPLDLPAQAARDLEAVGSRSLPLTVQAGDAATLERYFAASPGPRVRVIDLSMMEIRLEGGLRHTLDGRASALYSYRTPSGARLVCQMYDGRLADLPPPAHVHEQNGFRFQSYTRGPVTLVFWQEGDLVCVLASQLPADEVLALAVAKAMAPA